MTLIFFFLLFAIMVAKHVDDLRERGVMTKAQARNDRRLEDAERVAAYDHAVCLQKIRDLSARLDKRRKPSSADGDKR